MRKVVESDDNATRTMTTMIPEASPATPAVWLPPLLVVAASAVLEMAGAPVTELLRYDRIAVNGGQWWRLLSGNFVHLGWWHWLLNGLSFALLIFLCPERLSARVWLLRLAVIGVGMCLCLHLFTPRLSNYVGLSGLVYGLFALGFGRQIAAGDRFAIACLAFLAARIVWELMIGAPASEEALIGGAVVAESHLYGVIAAFVYGIAAGAFRRPAVVAAP